MSRATRSRPHVLRWFLIGVAVMLVLILFVGFKPYRIRSSAMEPTLSCAKGSASPGCLGDSDDRVLACRICLLFGDPSRGDIVVFKTPPAVARVCGQGGTFVKRIIGLPGETVREDDHGFIWIKKSGSSAFVKLDESYISRQSRLADSQHFDEMWRVPEGHYFVLGDNRSQSCDSRAWGGVPSSDLIGSIVLRYWPLSRIGLL